jgi:aryl sulfotransferase
MDKPLPQKTREIQNFWFDSTVWNDFNFRSDDIIISTYGKSGTTWVQQIISQLIFNGKENLEVAEMSPWLDMRIPSKQEKLSKLENQTHRRFVKTHLPVDALAYSPIAKYIYIGRDGRDVAWSWHNHHISANENLYKFLNDTPPEITFRMAPPTEDKRQYFHDWLDKQGHPFWPFWENIRTWWKIRHLPNLLFIHFEDLKRDMPGQIQRIADFFDIKFEESKWETILKHCSFEYMKINATKCIPLSGLLWDGGSKDFIHKGVNGRWRDVLTAEDIQKYENIASQELGPECANWLATGKR